MPKEMLINVSQGEECRIALMEDGRLEELYMERTSSTSHVGNIYKGRVTNVEPSIQAAFVDFGLGRNGFLHISDLMPTYFGRRGEDIHESVGRKMARRDRPPIQRCLRRGDDIIVQIIKEGIGTKGPTLSTYLSIPGKILVMMPGMGKMGVSKKIEDDQERRRLRQILDGLKPPKDVAFIIRTAGVGKSKTEIERDLKYLTRLWETIEKKEKEPGPVELYTEGDLVTRTVRDVFSTDVDRIIVDNKDVAKRVKEVIKISSPRARNKVELYEEPIPLFHKFGIEKEIELMYSRHVPLPSGGSLVIDSTEAIVAIDVNSGKFRDHNDAEMTAFKTDMEAAEEIPRQLKLRDLGGVIICDFIDLRYERHRRDLEKKLHDNFQRDRAKTKVLRMSQFGIIELTRQRMRPSLKRSIYFDCPHCKGAGLVKTLESMSLDVMRKLAIALNDLKVVRAQLSVCPDVAFYLLNKKRAALTELEQQTNKKVLIRSDVSLGLDEQKFELFDARDGLVILEEIGMTLPMHPHTTQLGHRPAGHTHQGRGARQGDQRGGPARRDQRGRGGKDQRSAPARSMEADPEDLDEDRLAIERGEEGGDGDRWDESPGDSSRARGEATPGREEDTPGIPSVLETEAGDEVAEEIADEEISPEEQITPSRRPVGKHLPAKSPPPRGAPPRGVVPPKAVAKPMAPKPPLHKPPLNKPTPMNRPDRPAPPPRGDGRGPDARGGDEENGPRGRRRRRGRRGRGGGGSNNNGAPNVAANFQPDNAPPPPGSPFRPRPKSIAEMAGLIAEELANESGSGPDDDSPEIRNQRPPAVGTPNLVESADDIGPAAEGGQSDEQSNQNEENGDQPRRRRRRRGGRRHRRRNEGGENGEPSSQNAGDLENEGPGNDEPAEANDRDGEPSGQRSRPAPRPAPQRIPPKPPTQSQVVESPAVVRTGSADKHLAGDEPIAPQPVSRPRSYRDLDAIPDDYD